MENRVKVLIEQVSLAAISVGSRGIEIDNR